MERNTELKRELKRKGFPYWQVAEKIGVSESTFIRWMRKELNPIVSASVRKAIEELESEVE